MSDSPKTHLDSQFAMTPDDTEQVVRLLTEASPEIASGVVEIRAIARKAGQRTKVAVLSHDPGVHAVKACVGNGGERLKKISQAIGAERIDVILWTDSPEELTSRALSPAPIGRIAVDPARHRVTVFVREDRLSLALGDQGVNRDLASQLCGWDIEVKPESLGGGKRPADEMPR
jgi:N utilization substance protein A